MAFTNSLSDRNHGKKKCLDCPTLVSKVSSRCGICARYWRAKVTRTERYADVAQRIVAIVSILQNLHIYEENIAIADITTSLNYLEKEVSDLADEMQVILLSKRYPKISDELVLRNATRNSGHYLGS